MEVYKIDEKPYVSLTGAYKELGIEPSIGLKARTLIFDIKPHIRSYIPEEHRGKRGRYGFNVIDQEGLVMLASSAIRNTRTPERIQNFLDSPNDFFVELPTPPTTDIGHSQDESITTPIVPWDNSSSSPTMIAPQKKIDTTNALAQTENTLEFVQKGQSILFEMFEGKQVRFYDDEFGMRWAMGVDMYRAMNIGKDTAKSVFDRIKTRHPDYIKIFNMNEFKGCAGHPLDLEIEKYFPELKTGGRRDRIYLNRYGIGLFMQELDIARIQDPKTQERCYKFRDWIAHLVGDVLAGDIELESTVQIEPTTGKKLRRISGRRELNLIAEQFAIAKCMSTFENMPEDVCIETALNNINQEVPGGIKGLENWKTTVKTTYVNLKQLPAPSATVVYDDTQLRSELKADIAKIHDSIRIIESNTVSRDFVRQAVENTGGNGNKMLDLIDTIAVNASP